MWRSDRAIARRSAAYGARDSGQRRAKSPSHIPTSQAPPRIRARDACDVCDVQVRERMSPASQAHTHELSFLTETLGHWDGER